jgi:hypothetical protein
LCPRIAHQGDRSLSQPSIEKIKSQQLSRKAARQPVLRSKWQRLGKRVPIDSRCGTDGIEAAFAGRTHAIALEGIVPFTSW